MFDKYLLYLTQARELRRARLQYYGESLQEVKQANYEVKILELRRERDKLKDELEDLKVAEAGGGKFRIELPNGLDDLGNLSDRLHLLLWIDYIYSYEVVDKLKLFSDVVARCSC